MSHESQWNGWALMS